MSSKININYVYSKEQLLDLYNSSPKSAPKVSSDNTVRIVAELGENSYNSEVLAPFFEKFSFIPKNENSYELSNFLENGRPRINLKNNGLLIFPVSGSLTLNTYGYVSPDVNEDGRPIIENVSEAKIAEIEATKTSSDVINSPIAIDGLTTYSLEPTEPDTIVLIIKIHTSTSWESVVETLESM